MAARRAPARQGGAALLILVAIAGLGMATLLISALGKNNAQAAREQRTVLLLAQASDALVGFAAAHGRLPRPAQSALDGSERPSACDSEQACTGLLPWVTLGVAGVDSWGKLLRYSVTPALTQAPVQSISAVATKTVSGRAPGGKFEFLGGQDSCELAAQCLPFVLYSSGKNNFGTGVGGAALANASRSNLDEVANNSASLHFIARVASDNPLQPGGEFDDLLNWITLPSLYNRMKAARNLP
ncbi:type II secretory pathway pseudopilin PulG [Oxalobacteraceae bacterium GrIS 1.11]